jgi:hypothetical protein
MFRALAIRSQRYAESVLLRLSPRTTIVTCRANRENWKAA